MVKLEKITKAVKTLDRANKTLLKFKKRIKAKKWSNADQLRLKKVVKEAKRTIRDLEKQVGKEVAKKLIEGTIFDEV